MNISFDKPKIVYRGDDGKYTIAISKKKQDGTYDNAYFPIEFNKGEILENKTVIEILNCWLSFYKWTKDDKKGTKFFIKCNEYKIVENIAVVDKSNDLEIKESPDPYAEFGEEMQLTDDDLPF